VSEIPDYVEALRLFLLDDDDVAELVDTRGFGGELPVQEAEEMPRTAIVIREAGGGVLGTGFQAYGDQRVDVLAYGATPLEASDLYRVIQPALKQLARVVFAECLLHWARRAGGPVPMRDPNTDWPFMYSSWQLLVAETPVAS
jgi:hypothetical protein